VKTIAAKRKERRAKRQAVNQSLAEQDAKNPGQLDRWDREGRS
jgi:hypothetical protein